MIVRSREFLIKPPDPSEAEKIGIFHAAQLHELHERLGLGSRMNGYVDFKEQPYAHELRAAQIAAGDASSHFWLAAYSAGSAIVGFVHGRKLMDGGAERDIVHQQEVRSLYVARKYRGGGVTGVAQQLTDRLHAWFAPGVMAAVTYHHGNAPARAFYARNGYATHVDGMQEAMNSVTKGKLIGE